MRAHSTLSCGPAVPRPMESIHVHPNGCTIVTTSAQISSVGQVEEVVPGADQDGSFDTDTTSRTIWVGNIPSNMVGGTGDAVLVRLLHHARAHTHTRARTIPTLIFIYAASNQRAPAEH